MKKRIMMVLACLLMVFVIGTVVLPTFVPEIAVASAKGNDFEKNCGSFTVKRGTKKNIMNAAVSKIDNALNAKYPTTNITSVTKFVSSNSNVVSIDNKGNAYAKRNGTCYISCSGKYRTNHGPVKYFMCTIKVTVK